MLGDRIQLQQVVLNLVLNGFEAMSQEGDGSRELVVGTSKDEPDTITVAVRDRGGGIDQKNKDPVFDTFFTTKPEGLGMGLPINRSLIGEKGDRHEIMQLC